MDTAPRARAAALLASTLLTTYAATLVLSGARNPLDQPGKPLSAALTIYPDGWANGILLACSAIAFVAALWLFRRPAAATWVAGGAIVALIALMDSSVLIAFGYLPAVLVGTLIGSDVNLSVLATPGLGVQLGVLATIAAFGWVIAGRVRAGLRAVEAVEDPEERARRLAAVTARTRRWTHLAIEAPLVYALTRVLMFFHVPGFDMFAFGEPILWAGLGLAVSASLGAWLTWGLIRPWGEVFPRWLPGLRGRRVPPGLAVVSALLVAVMVATAAKDLFGEIGDGWSALRDWPLVTLPMLLWPLWAAALAVAAVNYGIRRRLSRPETVPV